jgi:hypothetical protein
MDLAKKRTWCRTHFLDLQDCSAISPFNMDPTTDPMTEEASTASPTRGRTRVRQPAKPRQKKAESKLTADGEPKVSKPRTRKAPEEGVPKVSKRAKAMSAAANEIIEETKKKAKKGDKKKYEVLIQQALQHLEDNSTEVYADTVGEDDVDAITSALSASRRGTPHDDEFEVEDLTHMPASPLPASSTLAPWGPWALSTTDRSDGVNASLMEVEEKLKNYYNVPFEAWCRVKAGQHTKYTTVKRFGAKPNEDDFNDRKVVHAIVGDHVSGDKPGRICSAWKSTMQPWKRTDHETLRFYVQKGDLPEGYFSSSR